MALPSRSETMTGSSDATKVATRRNSEERKTPPKSPLSEGSDVPTSPTSQTLADAPVQDISMEEALSAPHLYHFRSVLKALATDEEAGLHDSDVKKRHVSIDEQDSGLCKRLTRKYSILPNDYRRNTAAMSSKVQAALR